MSLLVAPTPIGNRCHGVHADGTPDLRLRCVKSWANDGTPTYACAGKRFFRVNCPKINMLCSNLSGAWVAASVVCRQGLF